MTRNNAKVNITAVHKHDTQTLQLESSHGAITDRHSTLPAACDEDIVTATIVYVTTLRGGYVFLLHCRMLCASVGGALCERTSQFARVRSRTRE